VHDKENDKWYRVEVKSTDRPKRPIRPRISNLAGRVDLLAEVVFSDDSEHHSTTMTLTLTKISTEGRRGERCPIWENGDVKGFLAGPNG